MTWAFQPVFPVVTSRVVTNAHATATEGGTFGPSGPLMVQALAFGAAPAAAIDCPARQLPFLYATVDIAGQGPAARLTRPASTRR
jgi:hypothetical protein